MKFFENWWLFEEIIYFTILMKISTQATPHHAISEITSNVDGENGTQLFGEHWSDLLLCETDSSFDKDKPMK